MVRFGALLLLLVLVVSETLALSVRGERPVILGRERPGVSSYTVGAAPGVEGDFLAAMTPDDVVRGVWALTPPSASTARVPSLTDEQRATLGPLLSAGRERRHQVGELRSARREAEKDLLDDGAALVDAIGAERARAIRGSVPQVSQP